jgi:hypothetical protein
MPAQNTYELHSYFTNLDSSANSISGDRELFELVWQDEMQRSLSVLELPADHRESVPVGIDENTNCPVRCHREQDLVVSFAVAKRRLGATLSMTVHRDGVLVNGILVLRFAVLSPRDSIVIAPGVHSYVTERIRPYVGTPSQDQIGLKCPFCRIPVTNDTRIVTCRCGVVYHHETEESHEAIGEDDRLDCLSKVRVCLSCSRPVTLQEYLSWDPNTL